MGTKIRHLFKKLNNLANKMNKGQSPQHITTATGGGFLRGIKKLLIKISALKKFCYFHSSFSS
jgi:hypothetical protein